MKTLNYLLYFAIWLACCASWLYGQPPGKPKPQSFAGLQLGIGLFPTYLKDDPAPSSGLPLVASLDYRLKPNFSLGAYAGFSRSRGERKYRNINGGSSVPWSNHTLVAGLRLAAQSNPLGNWAFYGGLAGGLYDSRFRLEQDGLLARGSVLPEDRHTRRLYLTGFLGVRLRLHRQWSLFTELGLDATLLKAGLNIRLFGYRKSKKR